MGQQPAVALQPDSPGAVVRLCRIASRPPPVLASFCPVYAAACHNLPLQLTDIRLERQASSSLKAEAEAKSEVSTVKKGKRFRRMPISTSPWGSSRTKQPHVAHYEDWPDRLRMQCLVSKVIPQFYGRAMQIRPELHFLTICHPDAMLPCAGVQLLNQTCIC